VLRYDNAVSFRKTTQSLPLCAQFSSPPLCGNSTARGGSPFCISRKRQIEGAGAGLSGALCASPQCGVRASRNEFFAIVGKKLARPTRSGARAQSK